MRLILLEIIKISRSNLFDPRYYLLNYDDIRKEDVNPLTHFAKIGWKEGRNPSANFDTKNYYKKHPELVGKNINPLIHFIDQENLRKRNERPSLVEIFNFFIKGIIFFLNLNGIVFFAGYPYPEREKDGYYQRIRAIDTLFNDRWRIYIDTNNLPGREKWYDFPAPNTLVLRPQLDGKKLIGRICSVLFIIRCGTTYFHSILSVGSIEKSKSFWRYPFMKRILDLHGVVPEEFSLQGEEFLSQYYNSVEKKIVSRVDYIIVVTNAMRVHIENKYPGMFNGQFITLPIFQEQLLKPSKESVKSEFPVIVYAGGLQKWQQVPKMISAIEETISFNHYRFFCPEPEKVKEMLSPRVRDSKSIIIGTKKPSELINEYQHCHYGFILREEILVNKVACPTKLIEYLANGIIPLVDSENIGDFLSLGMKFIHLCELLNHNLPEESLRQEMVYDNFKVYEKLLIMHGNGVRELKNAIK